MEIDQDVYNTLNMNQVIVDYKEDYLNSEYVMIDETFKELRNDYHLAMAEIKKQMILNKQSDSSYRAYLKEKGFVTMLQDGLNKVAQGITTVQEVLNATTSD